MASQIPTSVTIINNLKGFQAISLNEYNTSAAASIAAGSIVEIAGAFFQFTVDETPTGWSAISTGSTAYIALTASGTAGSQIVDASYTGTAPTWRDDMQGWYASAASSVRIVASIYKNSATSYLKKKILRPLINQYDTPASNWDNALNTDFYDAIPQASGYITAGDYIIPGYGNRLINSTISFENSTTTSTYTKLAEYKSPLTGTIRVKHGVTNTSGLSAYTRVYKSGVAFGTERITTAGSTTISVYSEDLAFSQGDLIQLYGRGNTTGAECNLFAFRLCTSGYGKLDF